MDCEKYNIQAEDIYTRLMPYFYLTDPDTGINRVKFVEYLKSIASSLQNTQSNLYALCRELSVFLDYTGIHMSLEEFLNDTYDDSLRRIFITENNVVNPAGETWYKVSEIDPENKVWYTSSESDPDNKIWYTQAALATSFSFTINIPSTVTYTESVLRAQMANYVQAGRTFNIIIF